MLNWLADGTVVPNWLFVLLALSWLIRWPFAIAAEVQRQLRDEWREVDLGYFLVVWLPAHLIYRLRGGKPNANPT